jgi:nitroimidazol reductase NimA-like FMN-containing flavoprotein (pyridoxamine 5'-phosphate oxidase superfamily)
MRIEELTEHDCRTVLRTTRVARLACARNNQPYIVPISFDLDGDCLYSYATLGQKIMWMRENPLVCVELDELTSDRQWVSVIVYGRYEELSETPEYADSRQLAEQLFQRHPAWWEPASVPLVQHEMRSPIVYRIRIGWMTGRRTTPAAEQLDGREAVSAATRPDWLSRTLRRVIGRP